MPEVEFPQVSGRGDEQAVVSAHIRDAVAGHASTLLIAGEAGIGKTSVVREVCRLVGDEARSIWATCLPLTSLAVPLLPLRSATGASFGDQGYAVLEFDAWLERAAADQPIVLVVDDLQWADESTLDVLMYVIAGRAERPLTLLMTMRSGGDADRLTPWLADVRRLPRFAEMTLGRLDRAGTHAQLTGLLGGLPDEDLVDAVYERARGNPYLSSLLVRGLPPGSAELPPRLPDELRAAVTRAWLRLSGPSRELTTILAVGGRPRRSDQLGKVAHSVGFASPVLPLLREAIGAGILREDEDGRHWFAHPLLAEALVGGLLTEERRALHASFAAAVHPDAALDADEIADLADHFEQAGDLEAAFRWAVRAATATVGGNEELRLLLRALGLRPRVAAPEIAETDLLERIRVAAGRAGRFAEELAAVERLLALVDRGRDALGAAMLLIRRSDMRFYSGVEFAPVDDVREAYRLTSQHPDSPEHALATAELGIALLWHTDPEGFDYADRSLQLAGDGIVRAHALIATSMADLIRHGGGRDAALEAWEITAAHRRFGTMLTAVYSVVNATDEDNTAPIFRRAADQLLEMGAPHSHVAEMCATEAHLLLRFGDWASCAERLRVALGSRPGPMGDVMARLVAAELAARQGRQSEAEAHLARAEELFGVSDEFLIFNFDFVRAVLALAAGDSGQVLAIAERSLSMTVPANDAELLMATAFRVLADRAANARETEVEQARARLNAFREQHPQAGRDPGLGGREGKVLTAADAMAAAEVARGRRDPHEPARWQAAVQACREAGMAWEEAYCGWRLSQTALRDRRTRAEAAGALRSAYTIARRLDARPLLADIEGLARGARISLTAQPEASVAEFMPDLTKRERDVLAYILIGRTNSEIAQALFLSEKTVSVHITNMLRKTGAGNRIELAEIARTNGATRR